MVKISNYNPNKKREISESLNWINISINWIFIEVDFNNIINNRELQQRLKELENLWWVWIIAINKKYALSFNDFKYLGFKLNLISNKSKIPTSFPVAELDWLTIDKIKNAIKIFLINEKNIPTNLEHIKEHIKDSVKDVLLISSLNRIEERLSDNEILKLLYFLNKEWYSDVSLEEKEILEIIKKLDVKKDKELLEILINRKHSIT